MQAFPPASLWAIRDSSHSLPAKNISRSKRAGALRTPEVGETLMLIPRHVCPTVNNFDSAVIVRDGRIESVEKVSARGREAPLMRVPANSK